MSDRLSIVVVDDADDVRQLLRMRLRLQGDFEVVGEGATGRDAVDLAAELGPDLLLLDVSMPDLDGLDALPLIAEASPETKVVMFSGFEEQGLADRAMAAGAADFVEKSVPVEELADRLRAAAGAAGAAMSAPATPARVREPVLEEHLERFRAVFDQAAIGMATLTLTGSIVRANATLGELVGERSPAELVGCDYHELAEPDDQADVERAIATVASGAEDVVAVEHGVQGRSAVSTITVIRDEQRRPLYLFLQAQDVTERKEAEEALRRSEERFRLLVEAVSDYAIFMLDPGGHIASWNAGAQRFKGYAADEILGRHFSTFYPEEAVAAKHPEYELEVATREGRYEEEGWRVRKDGSLFWANVVITAVRDAEGELIGFAKVTRDVTERRALLEELEQAAAERTQLLAVTAHELRTPVALVNGFTSTLRDHWDELEERERREMVAALARSGERLGRLVDDLFTAARLESGALEVRIGSVALADVVQEVVGDLGVTGVELDVVPAVVAADRGRVQQMVGNFLTNAQRYGVAPIEVRVSADPAGGAATVSVRDHGGGVPADVVPRLFTKFGRGGRDGTGLGLFIVRELARAQGGDAWYSPPDGGGACFSFRLPLA